MKVLIVCSKNSGRVAPFIREQVDVLIKKEILVEYFTIEQKGVWGYLKSRTALLEKIKVFQPDIIHAHFGLSGLLANLQRSIPVVTTFHGSDINVDKVYRFSRWAIKLSKHNIFVSQKNIEKAKPQPQSKFSLIPCGVDVEIFQPKEKPERLKGREFNPDKKYILFSGAFTNRVKNAELAKKTVEMLENVELLELKAYTREEVAMLMNAVDACLMTSYTEGSPQFIKEAMACNCPIVSVDVGDVKEVIDGVENCYLTDYDANDIAEKLRLVLNSGKRTQGRDKILQMGLGSESVAEKLMKVYRLVLRK